MKRTILVYAILLLVACKSEKKDLLEDKKLEQIELHRQKNGNKNIFRNAFILDTVLKNKKPNFFLTVFNSKRRDSIFTLCNCQKDKKNNSIQIQLNLGIPTKKELDTLKGDDVKAKGVFQLLDFGYKKEISGQFKFLTIVLKDSMVKSIQLYSKSTEKEYDGKDFYSFDIKKYNIKISTFDFSKASNVIGKFSLRLPKDFGFFKNDTLVSGSFNCNNWVIKTKDDIRRWKIKEWQQQKNSKRGFLIE